MEPVTPSTSTLARIKVLGRRREGTTEHREGKGYSGTASSGDRGLAAS